jgi:VIT1/CCC1 family predicted Fe2+/Mn2+ transporter
MRAGAHPDRERSRWARTHADAERREVALIYQSKGLDAAEARRVAAQIMGDKDKALDTLTREEFGLDPDELGGNS